MISQELKWLWRRARPLRPLLYAQLCAVLAASILALLDPLIIKWLIDDVLPWRKDSMLVVVTALFAGIYFFRFGFNSLALLLDAYFSRRLMIQLRLLLLRHLQKLSGRFYSEKKPGDVLHRLEQDVGRLQELGGGTLASLVRIAVSTSLTLVILLILSWRLTLLILPLVPLVIWLRSIFLPRLRRASDEVNDNSSERISFFQDQIFSMAQIQLLGREAAERRRFVSIARRGLGLVVRRRIYELFLQNSTSMIMMLATAVVLGYGGQQVMDGALTVGGLVAFYTYLSRIFGPTQNLVTLYSALQRAESSLRRLVDLLAVPPTVVDPASPLAFPAGGPLRLELDSVVLSYGGHRVLDGVSLTLEPGAKAALVGTTGGGKSSLARLPVRLADPDEGRTSLAGHSVTEYSLRELRRRVALVQQEPLVFDGTVAENLRQAAPGASDEELWDALQIAQLKSTVMEWEDGLDTAVGVRGQKISGGQKQRLAVARAILQKPRLLILDEATAGLDSVTERRLLQALEPLRTQMTILLVAHRGSAIRWADEIFVLENGKILEHGSHEALSRTSEVYRQLSHKHTGEADRGRAPASVGGRETAPPEKAARTVAGVT